MCDPYIIASLCSSADWMVSYLVRNPEDRIIQVFLSQGPYYTKNQDYGVNL